MGRGSRGREALEHGGPEVSESTGHQDRQRIHCKHHRVKGMVGAEC